MVIYVVTHPPKEHFNVKGESLGTEGKLAVFYSPSIGRKRFYRQSLSNPQKGLKILSFKTQEAANQVRDVVNEFGDGEWKTEALIESPLKYVSK